MEISNELLAELTGCYPADSGERAEDERRKHPRISLGSRARVLPLFEAAGQEGEAVLLRDISLEGIGFLYSKPMAAGDEFIIRLLTQAGRPVHIHSIVQRCWTGGSGETQFVIGATFELIIEAPVAQAESACHGSGGLAEPGASAQACHMLEKAGQAEPSSVAMRSKPARFLRTLFAPADLLIRLVSMIRLKRESDKIRKRLRPSERPGGGPGSAVARHVAAFIAAPVAQPVSLPAPGVQTFPALPMLASAPSPAPTAIPTTLAEPPTQTIEASQVGSAPGIESEAEHDNAPLIPKIDVPGPPHVQVVAEQEPLSEDASIAASSPTGFASSPSQLESALEPAAAVETGTTNLNTDFLSIPAFAREYRRVSTRYIAPTRHPRRSRR